ncbi:MAG: sugar ABC transporter permease, partial [Clostridiales bacterium]|nr:sugar ABC transporter permease [Clostridiales bacterium]
LLLSAICAPLTWACSFFAAVMLRRAAGAARLQSALLIPYLLPTSAILLIFQSAFDYGGVVNRALAALGGARVLWLGSGALRLPVVLMYLWKNLGFCVVIFTAALMSVPEAYYEYAELEGASAARRALSITLPLVAPTAYLVFVLAWINAFKIFKEVYFIAGAYPDVSVYTLQHYMNNMFAKLNYQFVTTAAYSFAALVVALFAALYALMMRARRGM